MNLSTFIKMMMIGAVFALPSIGWTGEFIVYNVMKKLDMGNPGEVPQRDFYVTMGSAQGLKKGSILEVVRKVSSYDLISEKLYQDVFYPIARLKVIHVERNAAITRLEKMLPPESTPVANPSAVMLGDFVRPAGSSE